MRDDHEAKMVALLALLDVLHGDAEMTAVGADRIGQNDAYGRGGKIRLKFTVFGNETRLLELARELTELGSDDAIRRKLRAGLDRDEKLRLAARMVESWSEVLQRLLDESLLDEGMAVLPAASKRLPGGKP